MSSYKSLRTTFDSDGSNYYIGLARPTELTLTEDFNSRYFQDQFRHRLQSIKSLSNSSFVIDRVNWTNTSTYAAYDTSTYDNYHVLNSLNEVFLCVEAVKRLMVESSQYQMNLHEQRLLLTIVGSVISNI